MSDSSIATVKDIGFVFITFCKIGLVLAWQRVLGGRGRFGDENSVTPVALLCHSRIADHFDQLVDSHTGTKRVS